MAIRNFSILSFLLLIVAFPHIKANENVTHALEKKLEVVVETKVYCQSCEHFGTWSLIGAKPIASAKVSVTCKNHKGQVSFYKVYETDKSGYLYAPLEGFRLQHYVLDHPLHSCYVKPVLSPLESCSLLSNVNYGLNGAKLRYEDKILRGSRYEAVVYAAGPLAFRPSDCTQTHT
ncbi:unnamed protein product [Lupinus luteus]|uniref:Non-classical arabinogalactan protein 30 n=1 Tax=Lupinus luteus TaxID=3873 RepID=A0AAV1W6J6_LUPLU